MFDVSWLVKFVFIPFALGSLCGAAGLSLPITLGVILLYLVVLYTLELI